MFRKRKIATLLLVLLFNVASAQQSNLFNKDWSDYHLFFGLDSYHSFVSHQSVDCLGLKAGLEYQKKYRFGIGYYKLKPDIIEYKKLSIDQANDAPHDTVKAQLEMWKIPFGFEYILYNQEPWQFSVPIDLGYGASYYSYYDKYEKIKKLNYHHVVDLEAGISAQYILLKWVGVGVGLGYRLTLVKNQDIKHNFSSPVYSIKLKIFLGEIYRSVFPSNNK